MNKKFNPKEFLKVKLSNCEDIKVIGGIAPTKCNGQKVFGTTYKVKSDQKDIKLKYER
jgi:hypothetical protein